MHLHLLHKLRLQRHGTKPVDFAADVVVAVGKADVFHFGAGFDGFRGAFYGQVFDYHYGIAVLQHLTHRIFYFASGFLHHSFLCIPFVAALGTAIHFSTGGIAIRRLTNGTGF